MRINKFLSHFSKLSRRQADKAVEEGRVSVNNKPAKVGQVVSEADKVTIDQKKIMPGKYSYLLLNKPVGYVTSRQRQGNDPTIYELLPEKHHDLKPVGRLDKDTSGLLLLTNDGDYADQLMHPRNQKEKVYLLELDDFTDASNMAIIQYEGIKLEDGISKMSIQPLNERKPVYKIRISEGRNRQIRRTFEYLGYKIVSLSRTAFGSYSAENLVQGNYSEVSKVDPV